MGNHLYNLFGRFYGTPINRTIFSSVACLQLHTVQRVSLVHLKAINSCTNFV